MELWGDWSGRVRQQHYGRKRRSLAKVTQWRSSELTDAKNGTWNGNRMRRPIHAEGVFLGGA